MRAEDRTADVELPGQGQFASPFTRRLLCLLSDTGALAAW
jgi:hypothetical protein